MLPYWFVKGTAKRYFVKTSIPRKRYLICVDLRAPSKSIGSISPGYGCGEPTGCNFGVMWFFWTQIN